VESTQQQLLEARRSFERDCAALRPDLHRFCTRMLGSVTDGEDLVQETLVHAFYHLPDLRAEASLRSWLFRIAHNRCIDALRRRRSSSLLEEVSELPDETVSGADQELAQRTLVAIFTQLPSKERACVVLKDVLGYSLEEAAEITGSNSVAVKAALHRARQKLRSATAEPPPVTISREQRALIASYLDRFNQRDFAGARALIADDARLEVVGRTAGPFGSHYFGNYAKLGWTWQLAFARIEGELSVVHFRREGADWRPLAVISFGIEDGKLSRVRDYVHAEYLLEGLRVVPEDDLG
jgi:RNA polymerase sigma-70 factor, ECF subfamily